MDKHTPGQGSTKELEPRQHNSKEPRTKRADLDLADDLLSASGLLALQKLHALARTRKHVHIEIHVQWQLVGE